MSVRFIVWIMIAAVVGIGLIFANALYPWLTPEDSAGLARSLLLRVATMLVGFLFLSLALIALDEITPGDWLADIQQNAMAEAILVGALVFGLALIFIYS